MAWLDAHRLGIPLLSFCCRYGHPASARQAPGAAAGANSAQNRHPQPAHFRAGAAAGGFSALQANRGNAPDLTDGTLCPGCFFVASLFLRGAALGQKPVKTTLAQRSLYTVLASGAGIALIGLFYADYSTLRIPGVLQRIAIVYAVCALLFLNTNWKGQLAAGVALLLGYWGVMALVPVPGGIAPNLEPATNLGAWFDRTLLGTDHLWRQSETWDPEGLLSTLPAIATGISGMLATYWMKNEPDDRRRFLGLLGAGVALIVLGAFWNLSFPINKALWTSSYVLHSSGVALLFLSLIYWLADVKGYTTWGKPFYVYGANALFVFVLSGFVAKLSYTIRWETGGQAVTLKTWIYDTFYTSVFSPYNASLAFAITNVLFFWALAWMLYRDRIYIKV